MNSEDLDLAQHGSLEYLLTRIRLWIIIKYDLLYLARLRDSQNTKPELYEVIVRSLLSML